MTTAPVEVAAAWIGVLGAQSLHVSVVFLFVLLASRLLRRQGPAVHLALWGLVFVRLLLPPDLSHPWSLGALIGRLGGPSPVVGKHSAEATVTGAVASGVPLESSEGRLAAVWEADVLAVMWLLGGLVTVALRARRVAPFHAVAGDAAPVSEPAILHDVERWRCSLHVRRRVRVVTSSVRMPPFTLGVVRPVIFLPQSILGDARSLEAAVAHEMAHVVRWDALWLTLQHLVHAVYFFHPLVWIAGARVDMERERLCDVTVVASGRLSARSYVRGLLDVLRLDLPGAGAPTMAARKRRIRMRIHSILEHDGAPRPRPLAAVAVACVIGVILLPLGRGAAEAEVDVERASSWGAPHTASERAAATFECPLPGGRVTWSWGPERDPWTDEEVFHRGIDVAADSGTPVIAPAAGIVVVATENFEPSPASGTVVAIDHGDGWTTFYSHLQSYVVAEGQRVTRGETIATVGSSGRATGPHLHFEIHHDGELLDPADHVSEWAR